MRPPYARHSMSPEPAGPEGLHAQSKLTDDDFNWLRRELKRRTGIDIEDSKKFVVANRISRRLRTLGLHVFQDYCRLLREHPEEELDAFVNAITTNVTSFFREAYHFEMLTKQILPRLREERGTRKRLRIWSAGCSSGQEPYSIAMSLLEVWPTIADWDVRILATDIDTEILSSAESGLYPEQALAGLSAEQIARSFSRVNDPNGPAFSVRPEVRRLVTFRRLNLIEPWPMQGRFDVIFCRNVIIYFDRSTQRQLIDRMADALEIGGHLLLGHSESILDRTPKFTIAGPSAHQRV